ncbi:hypothetical protein I4U23_031486 [Adineta vaga]|nr:hypothetical protein I4U23_031486 [Adineta vaga]
MVNKNNDKKTKGDSTTRSNRRFDRILSGIYGSAFSTRYKRIPRTHSFSELESIPNSDTKGSTSTPTTGTRRITVAAIELKKDVITKATGEDGLNRKINYSRQLSYSTNFLPIAKEVQTNIIYNWSGIHEIAREAQIVRPTTVNQLIRIVRTTTSKLTLMGTGLSYEKLMTAQLDDPDAKLISMQHFNGLIEMKKETAIFGAATSVNDVIAILASYNRMLPCSPGVIGIQTLGGATATGTHGQGMRQSSYSDIVQSLKVVLPNGKVVTVDENTDEYPLQAFVTAMGTLGITPQVEITHIPRRIFSCNKFTCKIDILLSDYVK